LTLKKRNSIIPAEDDFRMKRVLIINESKLVRDFLKQKLETFGLEVVMAVNGFDGQLKIRNEELNLIIMDYSLTRVSSTELLQAKAENPNKKNVPVIITGEKLSKERLMTLAPYNVKKYFAKPIKMDSLIKSVSELMELDIKIDTTPCLVDAHFNDEILIIDMARGINSEKIDLLKLKIEEILRIYMVQFPKVLIIMTDMELTAQDGGKFNNFLSTVRETTNTPLKGIKILTTSKSVLQVLLSLEEFKTIEVTGNITQAMDKLLGIKVSEWIDEGLAVVREDFFKTKNPNAGATETIDLKFDHENVQEEQAIGPETEKQVTAQFAVVDDDPVIRELLKTVFADSNYSVTGYENGRIFIESIDEHTPDLVFLDLKMPEMDGFTVLQKMREKKIDRPVIILSAFTQKETVIKALQYGVKSYLSKPLKPAAIKTKTEEVLRLDI